MISLRFEVWRNKPKEGSEMRFCWGAQLSQTLGKTNFSFSPINPCAEFKEKTILKVQKSVNPETNIYENSFSSHYKKCGWEFSVFSMRLWGIFVQKEQTALKKGHSHWQLNQFAASHTLSKSVSRLVWQKLEILFPCSLERGAPITPAHRFNLTLIMIPAAEVKLLQEGMFFFPSTGKTKAQTQQQLLLLSCPWAFLKGSNCSTPFLDCVFAVCYMTEMPL